MIQRYEVPLAGPATVLKRNDVSYLDELWLENGILKLLPAESFLRVSENDRLLWMLNHALYSIPTLEMVTWLRERIAGRSAIEIGSGSNFYYTHLGIPGTDSYVQTANPAVKFMYEAIKQAPTSPRSDVINRSAEEAVKRMKPQVVVASYMTRKFIVGEDIEGRAQASIFGPREEVIIARVDTYIHIGNKRSHGEKTALRIPHEEVRVPGMITRGTPENDVVYIWERSMCES